MYRAGDPVEGVVPVPCGSCKFGSCLWPEVGIKGAPPPKFQTLLAPLFPVSSADTSMRTSTAEMDRGMSSMRWAGLCRERSAA